VGTLTRTACKGPMTFANVKAIQAQYRLQPLSAFLKQPARSPRQPSTSHLTTRLGAVA